jgi:hypothetical protein
MLIQRPRCNELPMAGVAFPCAAVVCGPRRGVLGLTGRERVRGLGPGDLFV